MTSVGILLLGGLLVGGTAAAGAGPVLGEALPSPLFPPDNWWNLDISAAPIDPGSAGYISFINNGGTRRLHPDFGGEVFPGSAQTYGMPYAVVDDTQPRLTVDIVSYPEESDGVGLAFYPIPAAAITQPHWVEGGDPGNVDLRDSQDRHLIIVDRDNQYLYELYNVYYNATTGRWEAGSGAFWDMKTNNRRPEGWTSADAAGFAILPGLVRHDEVYNPAVTEIPHAFRVTVRSTNGHVWPASHTAGSTAGALPMGARLRLKASKDISGFTPEMQKIFRAMKRYGLLVADNGSDMYITGTFDTRWDNDILNPAFAALTASDFEVIQLGWKPSMPPAPPALASVGVSPITVTGGQSATGTVTLSGAAPNGGLAVALSSANPGAAAVPASVTVAAGATSATFGVSTSAVAESTSVLISAGYDGVTKTATITVAPVPPPPAPALSSLTVKPAMVTGGTKSTGTVTLAAPAPSGGVLVTLASSKTAASVPSAVTVPAGKSSASFTVSTATVTSATSATISATLAGRTRSAVLWILKARK